MGIQNIMRNQEKGYDIRSITELVGITPLRLRAWENRYQLVTPKRSKTGRRIYSEADLVKLQKIIKLLNQGLAIGQVKNLLESNEEAKIINHNKKTQNQWERYATATMDAIAKFDIDTLDDVYNESTANYPFDLVLTKLIKPIFVTLGENWHQRNSGIAQEHFFSTYIRNKIGSRILHLSAQKKTRKQLLLLACLPNEEHEMGLLFFGLHAMENGFKCLMLGTNLPLSELQHAIHSSKPVLAILYGSIDPKLCDELKKLAKNTQTIISIVDKENMSEKKLKVPEGTFLLSEDFNIAIKSIRKIIGKKTRG